MPHIVKHSEKIKCIKPRCIDDNVLRALVKPLSEQAIAAYQLGDKASVFSIIEEVIDELLPRFTYDTINQFVEVKNLNDYASIKGGS